MELMKNNCTGMDSKLADLLLDPESVSAKVQSHVAACDHCRAELEELRATMALLDAWESPEPSPYFLTRMEASMREERAAAPQGWLERLRARFAYGPATHVRPLAAMALTILLLVGSGTYLSVTDWDQAPPPSGQAAVVRDLQLLDSNAQLLDQLESISGTNDNGD
jgi:anti-sigma factor RsiW